ncbi:hypothetical protein [Xylella fastidiosa]|uniref:hypothetical protein n=1 Tax=Xylella fastidiosa TaxID=2371 RepID=UPI0000380EFB|nr:hypothetical protein [Xylella fastidiosa]UIX80477.1 hypothetical protein LZ756_08110 [Xylella fastidiosa subsp. sandyi]
MTASFSTIESNIEIIQGILKRMYRITPKGSNDFVFHKIQLMYINTMDIVSELEELKHRLSSLSYADY